MTDDNTLRVRISDSQSARIRELMKITGLNRSDVVRALINNSDIVLKPMPGSTLTIEQNNPNDK